MKINKKRLTFLSITALCVLSLWGCGKKYDDYNNAWVSEDGKVSLNPNGETLIDYEGIDDSWEIEAVSDSGRTQLYIEYNDPNAVDDSNLIWVANATVKKDKLYLEIEEDNYTGLEGQTIVLVQSE